MPMQHRLRVRGHVNATLNEFGNECHKIAIPTNAKLDHSGSDWVCSYVFESKGRKCVKNGHGKCTLKVA
jgi:hypothetical protein